MREAAWPRALVTALRRRTRCVWTSRAGRKRCRDAAHIPHHFAAVGIGIANRGAAGQVIACGAFMRLAAGTRTHIAAFARTVARVRSERQFHAELIPEEIAAEVLRIKFADGLAARCIAALRRLIVRHAAITCCFGPARQIGGAVLRVLLRHRGTRIIPLGIAAVRILPTDFDAARRVAAALPEVPNKAWPIQR